VPYFMVIYSVVRSHRPSGDSLADMDLFFDDFTG